MVTSDWKVSFRLTVDMSCRVLGIGLDLRFGLMVRVKAEFEIGAMVGLGLGVESRIIVGIGFRFGVEIRVRFGFDTGTRV